MRRHGLVAIVACSTIGSVDAMKADSYLHNECRLETSPVPRAEPEGHDELVSVIVPAYNAAAWIDMTLRSVRAQTHSNLEIIVVDDGSTDATAAVVESHVAEDPRITLLRTKNGGVAAARNLALTAAKGRYFAPVDADDLWHRDKIALQLAAIRGSEETVGLAYCWYVIINGKNEVISRSSRGRASGRVLKAMCNHNLVGNGSAPLILRQAALDVGGFDPSLRARGAQGCEDYKLYFQIAETYSFALVRDYLVGYRIHAAGMSRDNDRMIRSRELVTAELVSRHPEFRWAIQWGNVRVKRFRAAETLRSGQYAAAFSLLGSMIKDSPWASLCEIGILAVRGANVLVAAAIRRSGFGRARAIFPIG